MILLSENDIDRFWDKVDIGRKNECWYWLGGVIWKNSIEVRHQYGIFKVGGKKYKAHRVSYTITNGKIPDNHVVIHKCDNPKCCNPYHLKTGTQLENDMDRTKKGRTRNQHTGRIRSKKR